MHRNFILVCILAVKACLAVTSHNVTLMSLLDAVHICKEKNLSDADILGLILRVETPEYSKNNKCAVACVLKKIEAMRKNDSINAAVIKKVFELFELPLSTKQISSLVDPCAKKLAAEREALKKKDKRRQFDVYPVIRPYEFDISDVRKNSFDESEFSENYYDKSESDEIKLSEKHSNGNKLSQLIRDIGKLTEISLSNTDPHGNVSLIAKKPNIKNSNESKPNSQNHFDDNSSASKIDRKKSRLYKRSPKYVVNECTEAYKFIDCFNTERKNLGYL